MKDYLCAAFLPSDFSYQRDIASLSRRSNSIPKSLYRFPCDIHRVPLAPLPLLPASRSLEACCGLEDMDVWRSGGMEVWRAGARAACCRPEGRGCVEVSSSGALEARCRRARGIERRRCAAGVQT